MRFSGRKFLDLSDGVGDNAGVNSTDLRLRGLRAIARDVAKGSTAVAGLSSSVQGAAVRGGAIARDVAVLSAGIALHGLSLAIPSIVIGA